jgi:transposase/predicted nucleic acid-binding Zn finger protein
MSANDKLRKKRAKLILSKENSICKINDRIYTVLSQSGIGSYKLEWKGYHWVCNCPDFIKNGHIRPCKHVLALKLHLEIGYLKTDEEEPKIIPVTYSQNWSNYNLSQRQEFELFDQLLYDLIQSIEESSQHLGRPRLKLQDQIFCCILKIYGQLSSRRSQCLFHQALERQQINHEPHYNAISKTLLNPETTKILQKLVRLSSQPLAGIETDFAVDSSGFRCSSFGSYCSQKHRPNMKHNWLKVHICTGVKTNIITEVVITDEHVHDSPQFEQLITNTAERFNVNDVVADLGYSSKKNLETVKRIGGNAYIPFKKNTAGVSRGSMIWTRAYHYFQLHREEFMEHYHKRSNVESTFAAIKRKFGETIKSKSRVAQENEMLCKIIAYNITVLIHAMNEFGINPNFCA